MKSKLRTSQRAVGAIVLLALVSGCASNGTQRVDAPALRINRRLLLQRRPALVMAAMP